jgi:hypothetical protein
MSFYDTPAIYPPVDRASGHAGYCDLWASPGLPNVSCTCHVANPKKQKELERQEIVRSLDSLAPDDRLEIFALYCRGCGRKDPRCQCENDE